MTDTPKPALAGIRVLDLSRIIAGPFCTMQLGDLGADVIKVEHPVHGDDSRNMRPPDAAGEAHFYLAYNRNKRSIGIDLGTEDGRRIIDELAAKSDILVQNFRPGVMARLGLAYETMRERHPHLIYCSISGYGQDGPMADRPGLDPVLQAEAGLMSITGAPDGEATRHPLSIVDITTAFYATTAILAAVVAREKTGCGQHIDVTLFDSAVALTSNAAQFYLTSGEDTARHGNGHGAAVPVGLFQTASDTFYMALGNDRLFATLCREVIERPDLLEDSRFRTNAGRVVNRKELEPILEEIFMTQSSGHWLAKLRAAGLPAGAVRKISETLESEEVAVRGMVETVQHPLAGALRLLGSPMNLSETPIVPVAPPPTLGQHSDDVLRDVLHYGDDALAQLRAAKVIN